MTTSACAASLVISTPLFEQRAEHDFGVHQVFGATERNHADLDLLFIFRFGFRGFLFHQRPDNLR